MSGVLEAISEEIRARGAMGFDTFMERALYDPEGGYYAAADRVVGRRGDFYTSVSVGPLFGGLLAEQIAEAWGRMGRPGHFDLVEQGGHDGQLAADILGAVEGRHQELGEALRYRIVEPLRSRREVQEKRLGERWGERVRWAGGLGEVGEFAGVFLCNELVDAFPCQRIRFEGGRWRELRVGLGEGDELCWVAGENWDLEAAAESGILARGNFPEGYTTEIRPAAAPWIAALSAGLREGVALIVDYGFSEEEYYEEERREGTLRCFSEHRADDDPFTGVGERDITAHVNFSRLAREARERGMEVAGFVDQCHFLVGAGRRLLEDREGQSDAEFARQFQTLSHPGLMGRVFKVLGLSRGIDPEGERLAGFPFTPFRDSLKGFGCASANSPSRPGRDEARGRRGL